MSKWNRGQTRSPPALKHPKLPIWIHPKDPISDSLSFPSPSEIPPKLHRLNLTYCFPPTNRTAMKTRGLSRRLLLSSPGNQWRWWGIARGGQWGVRERKLDGQHLFTPTSDSLHSTINGPRCLPRPSCCPHSFCQTEPTWPHQHFFSLHWKGKGIVV